MDKDKILSEPINKKRRKEIKEELLLGGISAQTIGKSTLGEELTMYSFGQGKKSVLYVGAHHALEAISENILTAFLYDAINSYKKDENHRFLLQNFTYFVIPALNPDGIALVQGEAVGNVLYDRQLKMSGGSFSLWQANARGVDLNHNYPQGFTEYKKIEAGQGIVAGPTLYSGEYPISECESSALMNTVYSLNPRLILSLHSQGEEIFAVGNRSVALARSFAKMTGYRVSVPTGTAAYGGFCDECSARGIPSITVEVGRGKNPLSYSCARGIYHRLKNALFMLPSKL